MFSLLRFRVHPNFLPTYTKTYVTVNINSRTPLHEAAEHGHVDIVRLLIQHGADANTHLQGLLNLASTSGSFETVLLFIELGADVDVPDGSDSTALHLSSFRGNINIVELLIERGVDVNARDRSNQTPLHTALSSVSDGDTLDTTLC